MSVDGINGAEASEMNRRYTRLPENMRQELCFCIGAMLYTKQTTGLTSYGEHNPVTNRLYCDVSKIIGAIWSQFKGNEEVWATISMNVTHMEGIVNKVTLSDAGWQRFIDSITQASE